MSNDESYGGYFAIIPSRACRDRAMTGRLLQLLCLLGTYTSAKKHGYCWPATTTLAGQMGVSRQAVQKWLRQLAQLGYLEVRPRMTEQGDPDTNMYRVLYDPELPTGRDTSGGGSQPPEVAGGLQPPEVAGGRNPQRLRGSQPPEVALMANGMADGERLTLAPAARRGASLSLPEAEAESERSTADPRRAALTGALARYPQYFGAPRSTNEWKNWNARLTSLLAGGLTPGDVPRAVNAWKRKYPSAQLTINALDNRLGELLPTPIPNPTPAPQAQEETTPDDQPAHDAPTRQPIPLRTREEMEREAAERRERAAAATQRARAALADANRRATDAQVVSRGQRVAAAPRPPLQM